MKFQAHNLNQGLWRMKDEGRRASESKRTEGNCESRYRYSGYKPREWDTFRKRKWRKGETRVRKYHPDEKKEETWGKKMKRGGRQEEDEDEREKTTTTTWHLRVKKKKRGGEEEDNEETQDAFPFIPLFVALSVALFIPPFNDHHQEASCETHKRLGWQGSSLWRERRKETDKKEKIHSIHFQSGSKQSFSFFPLKVIHLSHRAI